MKKIWQILIYSGVVLLVLIFVYVGYFVSYNNGKVDTKIFSDSKTSVRLENTNTNNYDLIL